MIIDTEKLIAACEAARKQKGTSTLELEFSIYVYQKDVPSRASVFCYSKQTGSTNSEATPEAAIEAFLKLPIAGGAK